MARESTMQVFAIEIASIFIISCMVFALYGSPVVNYILSVILVILTYRSSKKYLCSGKIETHNKAVLITGCDSGFGNLLAKRLDSKGFHVFASCFFPEGVGAIDLRQTCSSRLKVLPLDVTKDESVANALTFVRENLGSNVFWAVVNNAGISKGFSFDFSTVQHFKDTLDVNTLGPIRVTKAFLPLLKKSEGRVVNVSSQGSRIVATDFCAYLTSKHACTAFTQCLSLEMVPWGVRVISIEPEAFRTPITDCHNVLRRFEQDLKEIDKDIVSSYGEKYVEGLKKIIAKVTKASSDDVGIVVNALESAITDKNPNHVYTPRGNLLSLPLKLAECLPSGLYEKLYVIGQKLIGYPSIGLKKGNHL